MNKEILEFARKATGPTVLAVGLGLLSSGCNLPWSKDATATPTPISGKVGTVTIESDNVKFGPNAQKAIDDKQFGTIWQHQLQRRQQHQDQTS